MTFGRLISTIDSVDAAPTWAQSHGVSFVFDSDLGTDLGPDSGYHFRAEDSRLTRIDLYRAEIILNQTVPGLFLRLGGIPPTTP